ncbi:MAG: hypothetical protein E7536_03190 [Ruminococcaceae bacterium]|nr:hypothetical protein [Oscillospiraceae bacterium]
MSEAKFYFEWLGVEKNQFRILSLLAPKGIYKGTLSDMCRQLDIAVQTNNREKLKSDISELSKNGYITSSLCGRTYKLKAISKETVIQIPNKWLNRITSHDYSSENVSWQAVLKVLLWCFNNNKSPIVTRNDMATDLNIGVDTVTSALNVLEKDFGAIKRKIVTRKTQNGEYRCDGLEITTCAWWN